MSNHYAVGLLVEQHHAELRNEAAQDRLARLCPARTVASATLVGAADAVPFPARPCPRPRPTATVAAGDSPC